MHFVCPYCHAINNLPEDLSSSKNKSWREGKCGKCKNSLDTNKPVELSADSFKRYVEKNHMPVLVDFWAYPLVYLMSHGLTSPTLPLFYSP